MIFDLILLIFFQPFWGYLFIFLAPLIVDFLSDNLSSFKIKLFTLTFLTDVIFVKPLGFFMFLTAISFLILYLLSRFISYDSVRQGLIFVLIFNFVFTSLFMFFLNHRLFSRTFFIIFISNMIFQLVYFVLIKLFSYDRRRLDFSAIRQES